MAGKRGDESGSGSQPAFPAFDRRFLDSDENFTVIGGGSLGGKAKGLGFIKRVLAEAGLLDASGVPARAAAATGGGGSGGSPRDIVVNIPRLAVIATDVFAEFMTQNKLYEVALSDAPDDRIAHAFQKADLPPLIVGDLRALIAQMHAPLAVRSSSLLEDALAHPFAGTYATKMTPNNQAEVAARFQRLVEAIKFVYASTFFRDARSYRAAIGQPDADERMAVIVQEVVGRRHGDRFYPTISGVIRSYNFYPLPPARPADGVVNLALGLGKTIVDGGVSWTYSPAYPRHSPPFGSMDDLLKNTQTSFWAVHMGPPPPYDPINEAEYLVEADLASAEYDGTLRLIASTYNAESDRLSIGTGVAGPRVLNFAPILDLEDVRLNAVIERLTAACKEAVGSDVEIEFAVTEGVEEPRGQGAEGSRRPGADGGGVLHRFGFLQLRPTRVADEEVAVSEAELSGPNVLVATETVLGNGTVDNITDVVYVVPERFEAKHTPAIAADLAEMNRRLAAEGRTYVLIGFGRWGSSDPWLGIPVTWPQISQARVIVEATLPEMNVDPSQGSHFFHNMTSFRVQYLTVRHTSPYRIDWNWLAQLPALTETGRVRHVRTPAPLRVKVDGRTGRGVIWHP